MKDVMIKLVSTVQYDNSEQNDNEVFEMSTVGRMGRRDGKTMLVYEESDTIGVSGVKSIITAADNRVVIQRSGSLSGRLVIMKQKRHSCVLDTVGGAASLGVFGENLVNKLNDDGGILDITYTIDVEHRLVSKNNIKISVTPRS